MAIELGSVVEGKVTRIMNFGWRKIKSDLSTFLKLPTNMLILSAIFSKKATPSKQKLSALTLTAKLHFQSKNLSNNNAKKKSGNFVTQKVNRQGAATLNLIGKRPLHLKTNYLNS